MSKTVYYGDRPYHEIKCSKCGDLWDRPLPRNARERALYRTRFGRLCPGCYVDRVYLEHTASKPPPGGPSATPNRR